MYTKFSITGSDKEYTAILYAAAGFNLTLAIIDVIYASKAKKIASINTVEKYIINK